MIRPLGVSEVIGIVRSWLEQPGEIVSRLLEQIGAAGNLTTDAHLAALAIEYHAEIASTDSDFARFPGVRWINPLSPRRGMKRS